MQKQLAQVEEFHTKFRVPVIDQPSRIGKDRYELRHALMRDEVVEYLAGAESGDLENISKELADILYAVYGSILEHGLQDKMEEIFAEVHKSNMSKEYSEFKMKKGADYVEADIKKILS